MGVTAARSSPRSSGIRGRAVARDAVALRGLERKIDPEAPGEASRPRSGREHHLVRREIAPRRLDGGDRASPRREAEHLGVRRQSSPEALGRLGQPPDEAIGRHVRVVWKVNATGDVGAQGRLQGAGPLAIENLGADPGGLQHPSLMAAVLEAGGRAKHREHAILAKSEVEPRERGELPVEVEARTVEPVEDRNGAPHVILGACAAEAEEPADEIAARARPDVEGALGVEHPAQPLLQDTRGGQRDTVARHDQPRVAVRAARRDVALLHERDGQAPPGQMVGGAHADHPASDDDDHGMLTVGRRPMRRSAA
jgi:hypothetical protein